jgi:sugar-specific transcriptional regulator TrmB
LSLLFLGTALVGEISKLSKVRREEVYRILPKLEKMGLIEKTLTTPVKLKATPVENALSILIRHEEEQSKTRIKELSEKKKEFLQNYKARIRENKLEEGDQFLLISEKSVSLSKIDSFIEKVQTEIQYVASREKLFQFLRYFSESLNKAIDRGVKIYIVSKPVNGVDDLPNLIGELFANIKSISLRYLEDLPNHFLIVDSNEVLVATSTTGFLADSSLLWSNNSAHVMVYRKLFEDLWNDSVEPVSTFVDNEIHQLKNFIKQMKTTEHVILLYETLEAKFKVLSYYLNHGFENAEAAIYVCSESSVEEVRDALIGHGVDVKNYEQTGALKILDYTQYYIIDGKFEIDATARLLKTYLDGAIRKGFKGLRLIGETTCFFKHNLFKELVNYEHSLHKNSQLPIVAMYTYRADRLMEPNLPINIYSELVKSHGNVRFTWIDQKLGRIAIS